MVAYFGHQQLSKDLFYQQLVDSPPAIIAIDTETVSFKENIPVGFSIATSPTEAWYFNSYPERDAEIPALTSLLTNPAIKKVYANCLPVRFKALTPSGWKSYNELQVNEQVLGYNQDLNICEWTRILAIKLPETQQVFGFGNSRDIFYSTPLHRWYGVDQYYKKKISFTTEELLEKSKLSVTLSAPFKNNKRTLLSTEELRIIAWLLTDGSIRWYYSKKLALPTVHYAAIMQSKFIKTVHDLVEPYLINVRERFPKNDKQRTNYEFILNSDFVEGLWKKAGLAAGLYNLDQFILGLGDSERSIFFETVYQAEGVQEALINPAHCQPKISQKKSKIKTEAFQLLAFLMGYFPVVKDNYISLKRPSLSGQHREIKSISSEEVWCLTTELGSWVTKGDNKIFITGNCMFDIRVQPLIFQDFQVDESNIDDVLVMARLLGHTKARVMDLAALVGMESQNMGDVLVEYNAATTLDLPRDVLAKKCAQDSMVTLALYHYFAPQIKELYTQGLATDYMEVERKVVPVLVDMSQRGLMIDQIARATMEKKVEEDRAYYLSLCTEHDFNPGSGMQTGYVLAKRGNFLPFTSGKKRLKTDEDTLEMLAGDDPLVAAVLGYKRATSVLTKYLYPLKNVERLYTEYGLDTEVGRTKSSNFNMQNIPSPTSKTGVDVRHILIPDSGTFTTGDYSQEHLRIIMYFSNDKEMQRVYYDGEDGGDIHLSTAKKISKPRPIAKQVNYIIPYGRDARVLAQKLRTKNVKWCAGLIDDWMDAYPDAASWIIEAEKYGVAHGKALPTLFGRQIAIPEEWIYERGKSVFDPTRKKIRINIDAMKRKAVNYPVLGSDGEVMKRALIVCSNYKLPLAVQVHDSITCDGDITFPIEALESIAPVPLPFEVDKSERWK